MTLGLLTNQFATGLALALFGAGLSAFIGQPLQGLTLPRARTRRYPGAAGHSRPRARPVRPSLARLWGARARRGGRVVPVPHARRPRAARGRRVARVGARPRLPGAPHPLRRAGLRRCVRRARGRLPVDRVHAAVVRGHGGGARLDRARARDVRDVASGARAAGRVSLRWRHDAAVPPAGTRHRSGDAAAGDDARISRPSSCSR